MRQAPRTLLVLAVVLTACGGGGGTTAPNSTGSTGTTGGTTGGTTNTTPPANTVNATDGNAFNPSALTVSPGTSVTFAFATTIHNVTFQGTGAPANIPNTSNASVSRTFSTAGVFNYDCTLHPGMTGKVTVQ